MRLWLTRDDKCQFGRIWSSSEPPYKQSGVWLHTDTCDLAEFDCDYRIAPGTCTELYTEKQVRAIVESCFNADDAECDAWDIYEGDPSDANWARLMAEVGAGGDA